MAQLIVRKLSDRVVRRLKERAASNGRSAEEEHRIILQESLVGPVGGAHKTLKDHLLGMPDIGDDADFVRKRGRPRKVVL